MMGCLKRATVLLGLICLTLAPGVARAADPDSWRLGPTMTSGHIFPSIATLSDGRVMVIGGQAGGPPINTVDIFNPATSTWAAGPTLTTPRANATVARLTNGNVLVTGGGASSTDATAEVFRPSLNNWAATANNMRDPRGGNLLAGTAAFSSAALPNGKVLLAGSSNSPTTHADLYDPSDNMFHPAADMGKARQLAGEVPLANGKVLVAGGFDGTVALASGEVYDPAANTWTPVANAMSSVHISPQMAAMPDGKALVFAGVTSDALTGTAAAEIYDPATNRFTPTANMNLVRLFPNVTPLADGRVVVTGGLESFISPSVFWATTEVYQPVTGTWAIAAPMLAGQAGGGSVRLPSGEVFVVAGQSASGPTPVTTTQIYTPATLPAAPGSLTATAGNRSAIVAWSPPTSTGGSAIVRYTVLASTGQRVTTPDARTSLTLSGLGNGTRVTFTVTATNGVGTSPASPASNAVTPTAPDTTPPSILITRVSKVRLKSFLKSGIGFTVTPSEPSSLDVALLASASTAHISRSFNLTLAGKTLPRSTGPRKITLKPNRRLIGAARRFSVLLRVIATDAAGNRRTVSKTIRIRP